MTITYKTQPSSLEDLRLQISDDYQIISPETLETALNRTSGNVRKQETNTLTLVNLKTFECTFFVIIPSLYGQTLEECFFFRQNNTN